jgi:septal ring factor EnvC (AmiA/AmiB activator)
MDEHMTKILNHEDQIKLMLKVWRDCFNKQILQQSEEVQKRMKIFGDRVKSQEVKLEKQQVMIEELQSQCEEQEHRIQELRHASKEQQQSIQSLEKHIDCHYKCIRSRKQRLENGDEAETYPIPSGYPPSKRRKT